jgi:ERCC4-type nuclease
MTSREGAAKRKAANHPLDVIDLVHDSSDTEDDDMHTYLVDKGREVINLVDNDDDEPRKPAAKMCNTIQPPSWEVVLLVDVCEPAAYFDQLNTAGVMCERRRLATFDFLWVARRCTTVTADATSTKEFVLGYACERKEINDLANSLNIKSKSTGLVRNVYQKLKMSNSGVENKFYIVQGEIKDLYKTHMQWAFAMGKRVHENIKTMEEDGYTVSSFAQEATTQIVDFLRGIHHNMESLVANQQPPDSYMPLTAMIERADWVTELGSARGVLGEKMLKLILSEFPTSTKFKTEYNHGSAAMLQRLVSLKTDKNRGMSKSTAQTLCTNLFGVVATHPRTEHASKSASVPVTPEKDLLYKTYNTIPQDLLLVFKLKN